MGQIVWLYSNNSCVFTPYYEDFCVCWFSVIVTLISTDSRLFVLFFVSLLFEGNPAPEVTPTPCKSARKCHPRQLSHFSPFKIAKIPSIQQFEESYGKKYNSAFDAASIELENKVFSIFQFALYLPQEALDMTKSALFTKIIGNNFHIPTKRHKKREREKEKCYLLHCIALQ